MATTTASGAPGQDALAGLRLDESDRLALSRQGFLAVEYRGDGQRYYKLRWRCNGRQRVRYAGRDPVRAGQIRKALAELQRPLRLARRLIQLMREARRRLRMAKQILQVHVATDGSRYHGYTLRRPTSAIGPAAKETVATPATCALIPVTQFHNKGGHTP